MDLRAWMILLSAFEIHAVILSSKHTRKSEFDNALPQNGQLWSVSSRSRTECTVICQKDSVCLSYFYKHPQCTGFPYRMTSYVSTNPDQGLKYAQLDVIDTLFIAVLRGGWRDKVWLLGSSHAERRNTVIVEMEIHSVHSIGDLQGFPDDSETGHSLSGFAAIYICLRDNTVEHESTLNTMSYVEQRQRLVTYLGGSSDLYSLGDQDLASHCLK